MAVISSLHYFGFQVEWIKNGLVHVSWFLGFRSNQVFSSVQGAIGVGQILSVADCKYWYFLVSTFRASVVMDKFRLFERDYSKSLSYVGVWCLKVNPYWMDQMHATPGPTIFPQKLPHNWDLHISFTEKNAYNMKASFISYFV